MLFAIFQAALAVVSVAYAAVLFVIGLIPPILSLILVLFVFSLFGVAFDNAGDLVLVSLLVLLIDLVLLAVTLIASSLEFVATPLRVNAAVSSEIEKPAAAAMQPLVELTDSMPMPHGGMRFIRVLPSSGFLVASMAVGSGPVLLFDPSLARALDQAELSAIIAHECGHFSRGMGFSYGFLRRLHYSAKFVERQLYGEKRTLFRRAQAAILFFVGVGGFRPSLEWVFGRVERLYNWSFGCSVRLTVRFFRAELHAAESAADRFAVGVVPSDVLAGAIAKVACLMILLRGLTQGAAVISFDQFLIEWRKWARTSTAFHPSFVDRITDLGLSELAVSAMQDRAWISKLYSAMAKQFDGEVDSSVRGTGGIEVVQGLCDPCV